VTLGIFFFVLKTADTSSYKTDSGALCPNLMAVPVCVRVGRSARAGRTAAAGKVEVAAGAEVGFLSSQGYARREFLSSALTTLIGRRRLCGFLKSPLAGDQTNKMATLRERGDPATAIHCSSLKNRSALWDG